MTQTERVEEYIREHGAITQMQAMVDICCMRLASRISDLRRAGVPIKRKMITVKNRYGETCSVAQYSIEEE